MGSDMTAPAADDLVLRLRRAVGKDWRELHPDTVTQAADRIEAQAREIVELAGKLAWHVEVKSISDARDAMHDLAITAAMQTGRTEYARAEALKARVARLTDLLRPYACNPDGCECAAMDWDKAQCKPLVILNALTEAPRHE